VSLLFDENLSHRLIRRLEAAYPRSEHVELVGLKGQVDLEVWEYAARHDGRPFPGRSQP
jgi:predicted nuclease of predicted toxin-antitoxin system